MAKMTIDTLAKAIEDKFEADLLATTAADMNYENFIRALAGVRLNFKRFWRGGGYAH